MKNKVTLGGDRLGSGNKQQVELEQFSWSGHDLSSIFRSTMSAGTLVPFMVQPCLPGDQWEIKLNADAKTLPTVAPVFGSFKVQVDMFSIPMRLYNSWTHNNKLGIGLNMSSVKHPLMTLTALNENSTFFKENPYPYPINNSNVLKYLGISGAGRYSEAGETTTKYKNRDFNAVPLLGYWDIFKNYYANKQEDNAWIISGYSGNPTITGIGYGVTTPNYFDKNLVTDDMTLGNNSSVGFEIITDNDNALYTLNSVWIRDKATATPLYSIFDVFKGEPIFLGEYNNAYEPNLNIQSVYWYYWWYTAPNGVRRIKCWGNSKVSGVFVNYQTLVNQNYALPPNLREFELKEIDEIREEILRVDGGTVFNVNNFGQANNSELIKSTLPKIPTSVSEAEAAAVHQRYSQSGLLVKTYQSDIFNNWLNEETFTGTGGINSVTNIDTSAGYLNIDALELGYKVYKMLNQIAVSGGTYNDWQMAVYNHERWAAPEIPVYLGGLSKELSFSEIFSTATSTGAFEGPYQGQPLGTLSGKGYMTDKHKGGYIDHTVNELSYIMGIVSITPRLDYSQGNEWYINNKTFNDWHKPHLDQIGFQDLMAEELAWFGTTTTGDALPWTTHAIGKQPAWINYMTNINRNFGLFAENENLMSMVINRRYEAAPLTTFATKPIEDITTYIDPELYNYLFAATSLDCQNFWMQIKADTYVRRKMSAKIMPNL
ncbi:MAG: major capsid protein [Microviridae sp.]|nr:MAG: major capsid protein [Microviridae sp.]